MGKKKSKSHTLKRKVHKAGNYICSYCGKVADKIIGGLAYEYNPLHDVEDLKKWEIEQHGRMRSVFDIDIFIAFEVDHIIPESAGGKTDLDNLTLACRSCNRRKGAMTY